MDNIRIGTLVNINEKTEDYLRTIIHHGFESFAFTWWQVFGSTPPQQGLLAVKKALAGHDIAVSSISVFGNILEEDETACESRRCFGEAIDWASEFGTDLVTGFTGRVRGKSIPENIERFQEVWGPLADRAALKGVRLAFENCDMGGDWISGDWNIAHNPAAWELMFEALPAENIGLQWEPCHQMVHLIDPMPQIREWGKKFFSIHGKDATVRRDLLARYGVGGPEQYAWHRSPGFGDSNWTDIISELRAIGYQGNIDIEGWHDPIYRDALEMTGQVHALNYLKRCRGGDFVPNP